MLPKLEVELSYHLVGFRSSDIEEDVDMGSGMDVMTTVHVVDSIMSFCYLFERLSLRFLCMCSVHASEGYVGCVLTRLYVLCCRIAH